MTRALCHPDTQGKKPLCYSPGRVLENIKHTYTTLSLKLPSPHVSREHDTMDLWTGVSPRIINFCSKLYFALDSADTIHNFQRVCAHTLSHSTDAAGKLTSSSWLVPLSFFMHWRGLTESGFCSTWEASAWRPLGRQEHVHHQLSESDQSTVVDLPCRLDHSAICDSQHHNCGLRT